MKAQNIDNMQDKEHMQICKEIALEQIELNLKCLENSSKEQERLRILDLINNIKTTIYGKEEDRILIVQAIKIFKAEIKEEILNGTKD